MTTRNPIAKATASVSKACGTASAHTISTAAAESAEERRAKLSNRPAKLADRYSLRPEATRALDEAVKAMQQNSNLRIQIEGHTCNIGTAEYNLALGYRRANSVRDYLVSRGISTERMGTVSYGEERPIADNGTDAGRAMNRRAHIVQMTIQ